MTDTRPAMTQRLAEITELGLAELRDEWIALFGRPAPRLSRNLLARAIAHRTQEKAVGGLRPATARRLRPPPGRDSAPSGAWGGGKPRIGRGPARRTGP